MFRHVHGSEAAQRSKGDLTEEGALRAGSACSPKSFSATHGITLPFLLKINKYK